MDDERTFMLAMQADPEDNGLRLVFADWLEERGDLRGELIRLQHKLTQSIDIPKRAKLEERMRSLVSAGVKPVGPFFTNSIGMKFAWIPAGTFMMGSPPREQKRDADETQHRVTLTKGYYLAIHQVTQAAWREVMGNDPSLFKGKYLPVEQVSWEDCQEFHRELSKRDRHAYRLPTEAEWEYACRAGTTTPFYFGKTISTNQANYRGNYTYGRGAKGSFRKKPIRVGTFPANSWGLYDMHGNVWEWCEDWYGQYPKEDLIDPKNVEEDSIRVLRGGAWAYHPSRLRSALRYGWVSAAHYGTIGFRAARTFEG